MGRFAGKRILVVEDEYFIAADLKRALQQEDAIVVGPVGRLEDGMALVDEGPLDAAVLDVNLGGPTTLPLAERLAGCAVPCLFVTGYDGWSLPEGFREGPRIAKPFSTDHVLDTLAGLIAPDAPA